MLNNITQQELKELLSYDPDTGLFCWKVMPDNHRVKAGDFAGFDKGRGYIVIGINSKVYQAHRLAWLYMTGNWPEKEIDHINRKRDDNRFVNLREANPSQSMCNKPGWSASGFKWVTWDKLAQKWQARVKQNYKSYYLGLFDTPLAAHLAAKAKAQELHGEYMCAA